MRRYVEDLAFVIDGTRQIHPLAGDGNDDFILGHPLQRAKQNEFAKLSSGELAELPVPW